MSIGFGIFLIALGAILSYALNIEVSWIDLDTVGTILMIAGVLVTIIGILLMVRRRSAVSETRTRHDADGNTVTRRRSDVDPL
jgi:uncharacterized membrane protein